MSEELEKAFSEKVQCILSGKSTQDIDSKIKKISEKQEQVEKAEQSKAQKERDKQLQKLRQDWNAGEVTWDAIKNNSKLQNFPESFTDYCKIFMQIPTLRQSKINHKAFLEYIAPTGACVEMSSYGGWSIEYLFNSFDSVEEFVEKTVIMNYSTYGYNSGHGYVEGDKYPGRHQAVIILMSAMIDYIEHLKKKN